MAWHVTYGHHLSSFPLYDYENCKYVINFGRNNLEALLVGETYRLINFLEKGGKLVHIDPRFNTTAAKAYKWLPIKPGTDTALALGLIRVIIDEELYDKEFVEKATTGFDKLKDYIKNYSVEWAAKETEIPAEEIRTIARELAANKPSCLVIPPRRNSKYGTETDLARAIAILNALMGNYGKKGGFWLKGRRRVKRYPFPRYPKAKRVDGAGEKDGFPLGDKYEGFLNSLPELTDKGMVKALFVYGTNLVTNMAQTQKVIDMLKKIDLVVVIENQLTETALYADVILPECTYLERDDNLNIRAYPHPFVALCEKAIDPMYDTKPGWQIAKELGLKLGLDDYFDFKDIMEVNKVRCKRSRISFKKLKKDGVINFTHTPKYVDDPELLFFKTPSGKIELYAEEFEKHGFNPLPKYDKVEDPPEGYVRLTVGRVSAHTHARTQNNPWLHELYPENMLWINPEDAKKYGIKNGDWVKIKAGNIESEKVRAYVTERIRPGIVFAAHGWGRLSKWLHRVYKKGIFDNMFDTKPAFDPISHQHGFERYNFVKVVKA